MEIKKTKVSDKYYFCSNCNKEVEPEEVGAPISGTYYVCPFCKRNEADLYDDKKGLEYRERNVKFQVWLLIEEVVQ